MMVPMLLPSSLTSTMPMLLPTQPSLPSRGRKRHSGEDTDSSTLFRKRTSNSDLSDDDSGSHKSHSPSIDDDRRAHHNELERRRRDHIKDHFMSLKDAIPLLEGEKSSRALILKRAVEYISLMQARLNENQITIEELKRRNQELSGGLVDGKVDPVRASSLLSPSVVIPSAIPTVPTTSTHYTPTITLDSTKLSPVSMSVVSSSTPSSFTPVVPSKQSHPPLPPPSITSVPDIAVLLGLKPDPATIIQKETNLLTDLQRLLSIQSLAIKEQNSMFAPLLF